VQRIARYEPIDATLITNQLADVRELDPQQVENLAFLLVPGQPKLGANGPVTAVLRRPEVPAVDSRSSRSYLLTRLPCLPLRRIGGLQGSPREGPESVSEPPFDRGA
jgi:hypothetical protein